jgi:hypothetical protein
VLKEVALVEEKSNNAVIVGYPEQKDRDKATKDHDEKQVKDFLSKSGVEWADIVVIKRHGLLREGRHRPLKVLTRSNETREKIIRAFHTNKPSDAPPGSFCRRDYTPTELAEDRRLRSEAFQRNEKEQLKVWTVRNLTLIKLRGPNYEIFHPRQKIPSETEQKG